jgi:16S rRNA processing protein RimM
MEEEDLFVVGTVVSTYGIKGKIKVYPASEILQGFSPGDHIWLKGRDEKDRRYHLTSIDLFKRHIVLGIEGISAADEAKGLVGCSVLVEKKRFKTLPEGEYYSFEILGLKVFTESGKLLGEVKEIVPTGSNDVYVVRDSDKEYLIPAIQSVIKEIDLKKGMVVIHPLEGLI